MITFMNREHKIAVWGGEYLGRHVAIDTETEMVPFHTTPKIATLQAFAGKDTVYYVPLNKIRLFINKHYDSFFIAHNFSFDADVISHHLGSTSLVYDICDRNHFRDTSILYRLLHLATVGTVPFKYNLALLTNKFCGETLLKDERRENFAQFIGKPIEDIPYEYLEYGALDVIATYYVYNILMGLIKPHDKMNTLLSHDIQVKGELALSHIYKNGIGFDLGSRDAWLSDMDIKMQVEADILATWGFCRGAKGVTERYERVMTLLGIAPQLPRTKEGVLSSKREDLESYKEYAFVSAYLNFMEYEKATSFVRDINSSTIHPRYTSILNTGRTSCSKPNIQQLPRIGGVRELFIPTKKDHVFIDVDYSAIELATLAQNTYSMFGESVMKDLINEGRDLHRETAAECLGIPVEEVTTEDRQKAKAINFGKPGGLGVETLVTYAKNGYGVTLTRDEAQGWLDGWMRKFPEMQKYLAGERGEVYTLTGRKRGNTTYCAEKNTPFQGLAADGFKLALYELDKQGYEIVAEIHDQIVVQVHREVAEEALPKIQKIMEESMALVVPDVRISTEGKIVDRFCK